MSKIINNSANLNYNYKNDVNDPAIPMSTESNQITTFSTEDYPLSIEKYSSPVYLGLGERITYTIAVTNNTVSTVTNAQVLDTLFTGLTYGDDLKLTIEGVASNGITDNSSGSSLDFTITANIPSEGIAVITFTAINSSVTPGTAITNTATLKHTLLPIAGISSETVTTTYTFANIEAVKDLVNASNAHLDIIQCDTTFYYKISLQNTGDLDATVNGDDTDHSLDGFSDTLPSGFKFIDVDYKDDIIIGTVNSPTDTTTNKKLSELTSMTSSYTSGTRLLTLGTFTVPGTTTLYIFIKGEIDCA